MAVWGDVVVILAVMIQVGFRISVLHCGHTKQGPLDLLVLLRRSAVRDVGGDGDWLAKLAGGRGLEDLQKARVLRWISGQTERRKWCIFAGD